MQRELTIVNPPSCLTQWNDELATKLQSSCKHYHFTTKCNPMQSKFCQREIGGGVEFVVGITVQNESFASLWSFAGSWFMVSLVHSPLVFVVIRRSFSRSSFYSFSSFRLCSCHPYRRTVWNFVLVFSIENHLDSRSFSLVPFVFHRSSVVYVCVFFLVSTSTSSS